MHDAQGALPILFFVAFGVVMVMVIVAVNKRAVAVREMLREVTSAAGWASLQNVSFFASGVRGVWRQFPVELVYRQRQKSSPQRFVLKITARTDRYLNVTRRFEGLFSNRPLTWFGAPLIDVHQPSASQMWVRGDQSLAERVFADPKLASMIATNLVARFDELQVDGAGLRIMRALDDRLVRTKYDMPSFTMSFDPRLFEPIAREQIALAEAMVKSF